MLDSSIGTYGGPFVDASAVRNPTSQISAKLFNQLIEDVAQMTRTALRAMVRFTTVTSGNPTVSSHKSAWGDTDTQKPTVTRTGTGLYTVTYATALTNGLGDSESVSFGFGEAHLLGSTDGKARVDTIAANVVTLRVYDAAGTLSDLSAAGPIQVLLR